MVLVTLVVILNLVISFFNARSVGRVWAESKALGGWIRLVVWAGAVQSAVGFTYCYSVILGFLLYHFGVLPPEAFNFLLGFVYIAIVIPLIGSGIIITIESWIVAYRERNLANCGVAVWNTFAQFHNTYNAISSFGGVWDKISGKFGDIFDSDSDSDNVKTKLALLVAIIALVGGILTTTLIVGKYAASIPMPDRNRLRED